MVNVGDKVVMNEENKFVKEMLGRYPEEATWWHKLKDMEPLTVSKVDYLFEEGENEELTEVSFKEAPYVAVMSWVKLAEDKNKEEQ